MSHDHELRRELAAKDREIAALREALTVDREFFVGESERMLTFAYAKIVRKHIERLDAALLGSPAPEPAGRIVDGVWYNNKCEANRGPCCWEDM
jgi:hypothetical protein